jgi:hypothetical protein
VTVAVTSGRESALVSDRTAGARAGSAREVGTGGDPESRLAELARSRGALRRVLAALAAALVAREASERAGWLRLGYVRAGDYGRERLGLSGRSLYDLASVGRALAGLPRLEAALVAGRLPWSKVRLLARFVGPEDEAGWIAWAATQGVHALERQVRAVDRGALQAGALDARAADCDEDGGSVEAVETVRVSVDSALYFKWRRTCEWAAREAGRRISPGTALEMVTAETLSALPVAVSEPEPVADVCAAQTPAVLPSAVPAANVCTAQAPAPDMRDAAEPARPHPLPAFLAPLLEGLDHADAFELDARLRRTVRLEQRLDAEIAPLLRHVSAKEHAWRSRPYSLAAFARERLGMSPRKARALLRLERVGELCPDLRAAFRDGALSWVQAQILAPLLLIDAEGGWRAAWCRFAAQVTVRRLEEVVGRALALREAGSPLWEQCREAPERAFELEERAATEARQTCAQSTSLLEGIPLRLAAPREVARLFRAVRCSVRRAIEAETGQLPREAEAFEAMIDHALRSWGVQDPWLRGRARRGRRPAWLAVFERDGWRCTVPGCTSQRNLHAHHVRFRSAGGADELANLTTLCAAHHHRGVHAGTIRLSGRAPGALWFELGVRPGMAPLARLRSGDRVA